MTLKRTCALGCLAMLMAACGGSGSETPPPVEPTTPRASVGDEPPEPATTAEPEAEDQDEPEPAETDSDDPEATEE
jgi:hypothetical protein